MSNGSPPIQPAPVPPSIAGIPQPVFGSGSATSPAPPIAITGAPIIPPPPMANPVGVPIFPPTGSNTAPVPVPGGPLVGPAIAYAAVPPSVAGIVQPVYKSGSATAPPGYFPSFTTTSPSPPIVFANIYNQGNVAPPSTPGQTPPPIVISSVPTIPQLPWNPPSTSPPTPPVNTVRPAITLITGTGAPGTQLACNNGTWTSASGTPTYTRQWHSDGFPITGATGTSYTVQASDIGNLITCVVTATNTSGSATATSNAYGPIPEPADAETDLDEPPTSPRSRSMNEKPAKPRRR